jgi:hypothetical protein
MPRVLDRRPGSARRRVPSRVPARVAGAVGRGAACAPVSLEDAVLGAWQGLVSRRSVDCLICGAGMVPRYGASGHAPVGGRCAECGAVLG